MKKNKCPGCHSGVMTHFDKLDHIVRHEGLVAVVILSGERCAFCGFTVPDPQGYKELEDVKAGLAERVRRLDDRSYTPESAEDALDYWLDSQTRWPK